MFKLALLRKKPRFSTDREEVDPPDIPGLFPVKSSGKLLSPHVNLITQIDELAGVSKVNFNQFYREAIERFARFVQQLPASEVHHHSGPGGLLQHVLEVCVTALKIRRSYLLSSSEGAEEIARKQDLWTYAVFAGALCHDLAKPAVDQIITLYDEKGEKSFTWDAWSFFMDEQGKRYTSHFRHDRVYRLHEKASPLLANRIIPPQGMAWLASDQAIFNQWLASLSGEHENAGSIGEIISQADSQSVAKNLGADTARMPDIKTKPLHEKMLTSLRFLLLEGKLPLNRNGAAGWVKGEDCWLVSKRTVDAIREQLTQEGHTGIPTKNSRMFDELQENAILVPNGEKAIWTAKIAGDNWENELTVIKVPVSRIWLTENRPNEFNGEVMPVNVVASTGDGQGGVVYQLLPEAPNESKKEQKEIPGTISPLDQPEGDKFEENNLMEFLPTFDAESEPVGHDIKRLESTQCVDHGNNKDDSHFITWVKAGIKSGAIKVNHSRARVHVVDEGVLLVTPGIFQDCARSLKQTDWIGIQKAFLKRNLHIKDAQGLNVIKYQVKGKEKKTTVNGILIADASLFFGVDSLPQPNPHLVVLKSNPSTRLK